MDNLKHGYLNSANIIPSASNRLCTNQPTRNQLDMKKSCFNLAHAACADQPNCAGFSFHIPNSPAPSPIISPTYFLMNKMSPVAMCPSDPNWWSGKYEQPTPFTPPPPPAKKKSWNWHTSWYVVAGIIVGGIIALIILYKILKWIFSYPGFIFPWIFFYGLFAP